MNAELLRNSINGEIDFTTFLYQLLPVKTTESLDFEETVGNAVNTVHTLKKELSSQEFKNFEKILAERINRTFPEVDYYTISTTIDEQHNSERRNFLMLLNDHQHAPLSYVQDLFRQFLKSIIRDSLTNAVVEFYTFTNTLPSPGQVFNLYGYVRVIQDVFKDYKQLHRLLPVTMFYLKESIYEESSSYSAEDTRSYGELHLGFCRYDTGE